MKTLNYFLLCGIVVMVMGMATAPKQPVPITISYSQIVTPFINGIINACTTDCKATTNRIDCSSLCTNDTLDAVNENRNAIINKFGNVI